MQLIKKQKQLESICKHYHYCNVSRSTGRDCTLPAYKTCQTFKHYEKYGKTPLGVGALMPGDSAVAKEYQKESADFSTNGK